MTQQNVEWGYYNETYGDCSYCQDLCSADVNCGGLECGTGPWINYCSWWKVGVCDSYEDFDNYLHPGEEFTCVKNLSNIFANLETQFFLFSFTC